LRDSDMTNSLKGSSEIRCHKIFTADSSVIVKKISHLHAARQPALLSKIVSLL
jgi:hypothetical protein